MNITQTRPAKKSGVKIDTPNNFEVKVGRDKVVTRNRDLVEVMQYGVRTIINKDNLDDWKAVGWKTDEDIKTLAEEKMNKIKRQQVKNANG